MNALLQSVASVVAPPAEGEKPGAEAGEATPGGRTPLAVLAKPPPLSEKGFPESRVAELGLAIPQAPPAAVANYRPVVVVGDLLYVSGQIARNEAGAVMTGRLGQASVEDGVAAARQCGVATLAVLKATLGSLDRVVRLVKADGFVNTDPREEHHFATIPSVVDGFSNLMVDVFGESGKGARAAVGAMLPLCSLVEVASVWQGPRGLMPEAGERAPAAAGALRSFLAAFRDELADEGALESDFDDTFVWESPTTAYTSAVAQHNDHAALNRYVNILPYDHALVPVGEGPSREYINASRLASTQDDASRWRYICTQGPLPHTAGTFWRMVHENNPVAIAMLTSFVENRVQKCHDYFPRTPKEELFTDDGDDLPKLRIACENVTQLVPGLEERIVVVEDVGRADGRTVRLSHFHYTEWPDHGTPDSTKVLRLLIHRIRKLEEERRRADAASGASGGTEAAADSAAPPQPPPLIAHCSAGIGRTGVFCACDVLIRRIDAYLKHASKRDAVDAESDERFATQFLNLKSLIKFFRTQRIGMVQTREQYVFCFRLIKEELELRLEMQ